MKAWSNDYGNLYGMLQESQHGFYYMLANSNVINGLTKNMEYRAITPAWQIALYTIDGVFGVATVILAIAYVFTTFGKKKQNER